ncbi:MAG TPA: helix-turn-helix domain-containing protein [Methylomirabilota bacterium]|nr:helix-turn-helix domain-containing protein [Methylomirabilota bacterium]
MTRDNKRRKNPPRGLPDKVHLLTTTQAAHVLGVSTRTLYRYMDEGLILRAGTVGQSYVFYADEVEVLRQRLGR